MIWHLITEVWPQNTQLGGFEVGVLPLLVVDAQLVDATQTTTKSSWEKAQKTQQSSKN